MIEVPSGPLNKRAGPGARGSPTRVATKIGNMRRLHADLCCSPATQICRSATLSPAHGAPWSTGPTRHGCAYPAIEIEIKVDATAADCPG
jgi:hypothetical protein